MDSDGQDSGRAIPRYKEATMNKISREECYQTVLVNLWNHIDALQKEVERLEKVSGHQWPDGAVKIRKQYVYDNGTIGPVTEIPRPAPKTRERTMEEKIEEFKRRGVFPNLWNCWESLQDSTIDDLCLAAGIELTVTEE